MDAVEVLFVVLWAALGLLFLWGALVLLRMAFRARSERVLLLGSAGLALLGALIIGVHVVESVMGGNDDMTRTMVDREQGVACVVEVLEATDREAWINNRRIYGLRLRVETPGKPVYETTSTATLSSFEQGGLGARLADNRWKYHCLADREQPRRVEVLLDRPIG